jgi:putative ABC transport system permease protein
MPVKTTYRENIAIALNSIGGNRLRTSLTALIIAIGIMALVGILTAINGITQQTNDTFAGLGANSFTIENRGSDLGFGNGGHVKQYPAITYEQGARFVQSFNTPALVSVNLMVSGTAVVEYGNKKSNPNIQFEGTNDNYLFTNGYKLAEGRNFSSTEMERASGVIILGSDLKDKLFKHIDPLGKSVFIGSSSFKVIGVLASKGSSMGFNGDRLCITPVLKAKQMDTVSNPSFTISVKANSPEQLDPTIDEAISTFRNIRDLRVTDQNNFEINRSDSIQKQLAGNLFIITCVGMAIALITLTGAAIGLMNIMLVSVTERTREIGVRKAIGATPSIIRKQFLIEAIVICLIGGAAGVILGMMAGNLIVLLTKGSFVIPWAAIIGSFIACTVIGLISGYYPANKASKLDPVESLRYE